MSPNTLPTGFSPTLRRAAGVLVTGVLLFSLLLSLNPAPALADGEWCNLVQHDEFETRSDGSVWWRLILEAHCNLPAGSVSADNPAYVLKNGVEYRTFTKPSFKFELSTADWSVLTDVAFYWGGRITHDPSWQLALPPLPTTTTTTPSSPTTTAPKSSPTTTLPKSSPPTTAPKPKDPSPKPTPPGGGSDKPAPPVSGGGHPEEPIEEPDTVTSDPSSDAHFYCQPQILFLPSSLRQAICADLPGKQPPASGDVPAEVPGADAANPGGAVGTGLCVDLSLGWNTLPRPVLCVGFGAGNQVMVLHLVIGEQVRSFGGPALPI